MNGLCPLTRHRLLEITEYIQVCLYIVNLDILQILYVAWNLVFMSLPKTSDVGVDIEWSRGDGPFPQLYYSSNHDSSCKEI